jgi:hypothetical protein
MAEEWGLENVQFDEEPDEVSWTDRMAWGWTSPVAFVAEYAPFVVGWWLFDFFGLLVGYIFGKILVKVLYVHAHPQFFPELMTRP